MEIEKKRRYTVNTRDEKGDYWFNVKIWSDFDRYESGKFRYELKLFLSKKLEVNFRARVWNEVIVKERV